MLNKIVNVFFPGETITEIKAFGNGHINDTYKLILESMTEQYILQRINQNVFPDPKGIIHTHHKLQNLLEKENHTYCIPKIFTTSEGQFLHFDSEGNAWRMTNYIADSYTIEIVEEDWQAYEAGSAYGWFANVCTTLNPLNFKEAIKDFHKLSFRIAQLNQAISENAADRLKLIPDVIDFYKKREAALGEIESLVESGEIPLRIVHNDTKINNLLFRNKNATAVIDLDTVGPGILFYDYGDALRTSANTAAEDEKDLNKVHFNLNAFSAFTSGYIENVKNIMSTKEAELLYKAPVLMTYIIGIRFLTDYLNGDIYYKTAYPDHNLTRTRVQKALIESMESSEDKMKHIISEAIFSKSEKSKSV